VLERCGVDIKDVDVFEVCWGFCPHMSHALQINEAFSSMYVHCVKKLGLDVEKVNPVGGAIALGHPYGCSKSRLVPFGEC
jgi:hypothetical protein